MDLDAWLAQDLTSDETKEAYRYFMRPEPKDVRSDIEIDATTGLRYRMMAIGMLRNASEENRKVVRVYLDPIPHIILKDAKPLQGWYKAKREPKGVRARPCFTDAILTEPYGGFCAVGCAFCYVNSGFRGYRGTGLISVPQDYGGQVRAQLAKTRTSAAGYFSSFTDPFLPLEDVYHNTQRGAEAFVELGLPIFFLSRLRYPGWAYDLLRKNRYSYAQKSINCADARDWKLLSPGAAPLAEHMDEIRELRRQGIYVSIQVNPIVPGVVTHEGVEATLAMLAEAGANHVIVKFVEAGYSWAPAMVERVKKRFGETRGGAFEGLFSQNIGGQRTVAEEYRIEGHVRYKAAATKLGLTYATCYEYKLEYGRDGKPLDRVGVSIGRDFLTADQCHGHRVPMFTRADAKEPFREVEECPPTGCLHCADDNKGKPRCGSETFGAAPALRLRELKIGVYQDDARPPGRKLPVVP